MMNEIDYMQKAAIVRCTRCDTTLQSQDVHDFRNCKCGNIFVDGGNEYDRRGWHVPEYELLKPFGTILSGEITNE